MPFTWQACCCLAFRVRNHNEENPESTIYGDANPLDLSPMPPFFWWRETLSTLLPRYGYTPDTTTQGEMK
jgi:hypothetical protein